MKKLLLFLMLGIFFISLASAEGSIGTVKQNDCIDLYQICPSCSYVNLTAVKYPNATISTMDLEMTQEGNNFNYNFCNTTTSGEHFYTVCGDKDGTEECEQIAFEVTYSGKIMSSSNAILYVPIYLLLGFLFVITIYGINALPNSNATDEEGTIMKISYLKYLRSVLYFVLWMFIVAVFYISSNLGFAYLPDTLIANFFLMLLKISYGLTLPIIVVWFIYIFAQIIDDKKIKSLWERGMYSTNF